MTWAAAREALVDIFNGETVQVPGQGLETLTMLEFPPAGDVGPNAYPLAYVVPPPREVRRFPGGMRAVAVETARVTFLLHATNREIAARRLEAWAVKATDIVGENLTLNGAVTVVNTQAFTEFSGYGREGGPPYGFDMELGVQIHDHEDARAG
jgi:hypothetical protein